ncbi:cytochrome P450 [Conexibacter sp. SYSU D00693]|uniref:cytochrome P450 n=1 Tax=Conexibacter sp. SYSU D00693 TaxID=2812560 RepID=UPI00196A2742|nr:cytochrome P450 [Conexibacter sp. SYSU D00693]
MATVLAPAPALPRPPRPKGLPLVGVVPQIARDPYGSFQRIAREHGDVVELAIPGMPTVLVSHPDHVRHITNTRHAAYPKPEMFRDAFFRDAPRFHGMANGAEWKRVRRMLNPKFTAKGLAPLQDRIIGAIEDHVGGWSRFAGTGATVDLQREFSLVTMRVLLRSMFTRPAPDAEVEHLAEVFERVMHGMAIAVLTTPLPGWVPRPRERRYDEAKAEVFAYVDRMLAERRAEGTTEETEGDLLDMVLHGEFDDGTTMTDEHIRREMLGLIFGGYETTAAVMSWTIARLAFAPEARERAYAEVDALGTARLTNEDLDALPWLRACFDEAQRLQGFVLNAREATEDDEIAGFHIPAGTTVAFSGQTLHRDPRWWRDPDAFSPSRFLEDDVNPYAFVPFGVGPRRCLGFKMAYQVGLWTLAEAFRRFRFTVPPGWTPEPRFVFSTTVKGGVPVTIEVRA